jgi:hypothetical protein
MHHRAPGAGSRKASVWQILGGCVAGSLLLGFVGLFAGSLVGLGLATCEQGILCGTLEATVGALIGGSIGLVVGAIGGKVLTSRVIVANRGEQRERGD